MPGMQSCYIAAEHSLSACSLSVFRSKWSHTGKAIQAHVQQGTTSYRAPNAQSGISPYNDTVFVFSVPFFDHKSLSMYWLNNTAADVHLKSLAVARACCVMAP